MVSGLQGGCFADVINRYRCKSIARGRRCQLCRDHLERGIDHAAAWVEPLSVDAYRGRRGVVAPKHWWRWTSELVVREQAPGSERLPWACLGSR